MYPQTEDVAISYLNWGSGLPETGPKEVCWKTPADSGGVKAQGLPTLPPNCLLQWPE